MKRLDESYTGAVVTEQGNMGLMLQDYLEFMDAHDFTTGVLGAVKDATAMALQRKDCETVLALLNNSLPKALNQVAPKDTVFKEHKDKWGFFEQRLTVSWELKPSQYEMVRKALVRAEISYARSPELLKELRTIARQLADNWEVANGTVSKED